jgi:hypothetical protein
MRHALVISQVMVVIFVALHDWVPLGKLSNLAGLRAVDTTSTLALTTVLSTLPFAAVLIASTFFVSVDYPGWLLWWLWGTYVVCAYVVCAYGILRAWWIPYLGSPDAERAKRHNIRFAGTHGFLPLPGRPVLWRVAAGSLDDAGHPGTRMHGRAHRPGRISLAAIADDPGFSDLGGREPCVRWSAY